MAVHHITDADVEDAPKRGDLWKPFWDGCGQGDIAAAQGKANQVADRGFDQVGHGRDAIPLHFFISIAPC